MNGRGRNAPNVKTNRFSSASSAASIKGTPPARRVANVSRPPATASSALARKADALPPLLRTWLSWWRDLALLAYGRRTADTISNIDEVELLYELAGQWPRGGVLAALRQTEAALRQLRQNANARLVLENVMLSYPRRA